MAEIVKILSSEIALSTANTVSSASVVRVYNNTAGAALITRANGGTTVGTITVGAGEVVYLQKTSSDTFASNAAVRAVSVSFN